jgi:hypothetical protein
VRVYRGESQAPDVDNWGSLLYDGLRLIIIGLLYEIPIIILWYLTVGRMIMEIVSQAGSQSADPASFAGWTPNPGLLILMYLFVIVVAIFVPIASIRFARAGKIGEAFHFGAILEDIRRIGWIHYIIAIILIALIIAIPVAVLVVAFIIIAGLVVVASGFNPGVLIGAAVVALVLVLALIPLISVFHARFLTRVYESASPPV